MQQPHLLISETARRSTSRLTAPHRTLSQEPLGLVPSPLTVPDARKGGPGSVHLAHAACAFSAWPRSHLVAEDEVPSAATPASPGHPHRPTPGPTTGPQRP